MNSTFYGAGTPDYKLKALHKVTSDYTTVGAAWVNKRNGAISVKLNPCVVLKYDQDIVLTLFPTNDEPEEPKVK